MSSPFPYGPCNLYLNPVWVKLPTTPEVEIQLKPLSHAGISTSQETLYILSKSDKFSNIDTYVSIVQLAVVAARNAIGFKNPVEIIEQLPSSDVVYLYERLQEISIVTPEQIKALDAILEIQFNPAFDDESWDCKICQQKKLDYSRACGLLPKDKRDPNPVLPRVGGKIQLQCPISTVDGYALSQATLAYTLFDSGNLPEVGGIGAQTEWFVRAALLYKRKIAEAEKAAYDKLEK